MKWKQREMLMFESMKVEFIVFKSLFDIRSLFGRSRNILILSLNKTSEKTDTLIDESLLFGFWVFFSLKRGLHHP